MSKQHFTCPNCGPAGYKVVIRDSIRLKACNCCGETKRFNNVKSNRPVSQALLDWLDSLEI